MKWFIPLFFATQLFAADPVGLHMTMTAGDEYKCHLRVESEFGRVLAQSTDIAITCRVQEVDADGVGVVDVGYDRIGCTMKSPEAEFAFDSDTSTSVPEGCEPLAALVGKAYRVRLTPSAEVVDVAGFDKILDAIVASCDPSIREMVKLQIEETYKEGGGHETLSRICMHYPKEPVNVGASWEPPNIILEAMPTESTPVMTLRAINDKVARLTIGSKQEDIHGEVTVDRKTGWVLSALITGQAQLDAESQINTKVSIMGSL